MRPRAVSICLTVSSIAPAIRWKAGPKSALAWRTVSARAAISCTAERVRLTLSVIWPSAASLSEAPESTAAAFSEIVPASLRSPSMRSESPPTAVPIPSAAFAVLRESSLIASATTAKPRPASPARTASILALIARMFTCVAIERISVFSARTSLSVSVTSAIRLTTDCTHSAIFWAWAPVWRSWPTAWLTADIVSSAACET